MKKMLKSVFGILFIISLIYSGASAYSAKAATDSNPSSEARPDLQIIGNGSGVSVFQLPIWYRVIAARAVAGSLIPVALQASSALPFLR